MLLVDSGLPLLACSDVLLLGDPAAERDSGLLRKLDLGFQHARWINALTLQWLLGPAGCLNQCVTECEPTL